MTVTATTDGATVELVCPDCHSPVTRDDELGLYGVVCDTNPNHLWLLDTLIHRQPTRSTT